MLNFKPHSNIQRLRLENQKKLDKIDKAINQSNHTKRQGFNALFGGGIPVRHNRLSKSDWMSIKQTLNHAAQLHLEAKHCNTVEREEYIQKDIAKDLDKILRNLGLS
ncbi:hypothetical protein [Lactococcus lactis]|uniref:hypothetical protein n=1 Tax=Lactococcus lactis TaxID=1358 RepID=UPI00288D6A2C|nr:hypothetical protein [Lactococcus lactis]MDT2895839.1 hypothetical protein [Lactococcus lactis]